jgi:hypothetical protein
MTFLPVPGRASGDLLTETMWDRYLRDNMNKGVMRPIADSLLGSSAASVTFSSIPTDFEALVLTGVARSDVVGVNQSMYLRFNDDSAANYDRCSFDGVVSGHNGAEATAQLQLVLWEMPGSTGPASAFTGGYLLVLGPNRAAHKVAYAQSTMRQANGSGGMSSTNRIHSWRSTAAITKMTLTPATAVNFVAGSRFTLYGLGGT